MSALISSKLEVLGIDSFSPYYSVNMKNKRQLDLGVTDYTSEVDINNRMDLLGIFQSFKPNIVINLAGQGGVRASKKNPRPYLESNQIGFLNLLEASKLCGVQKFIFASSSSVYGNNQKPPFQEDYELPYPKSLYALSKISNEMIAKNFVDSKMSITGLRFFTVYGPWGRPDMAIFRLIASSILNKPFELSASLNVMRDFTFVDDVSKVILGLILQSDSIRKYEVFNVAGGRPYTLNNLLQILEKRDFKLELNEVGRDEADLNFTHGSTEKLAQYNLPVPDTTLEIGIDKTISWFETIEEKYIDEWFSFSRNV
jgi:UDP-glucuronate 4-epimerase